MAEEKIIKVVKEAMEKAPKRNFTESVELAFNLKDVDLSNPKNRITEEIILPKGRGKDVKIGLFGTQEMVSKAKDIADLIILSEEISKMGEEKRDTKNKIENIDFFVAEAPLMALVGKNLGVILGPRGKMPRPIPPGGDPTSLIENLRKTVKVRSKDKRTFHVAVGTRDMPTEDIADNIEAVVNRLRSKLERGLQNIHTAYIKTTMGPSIKLELR
ncbi:MAG: 50S ribosomal protein L1 [Candidatus Thermoplasmatota archaeon]|nr:50S ribosomal protein L1 [Candidatus Thermoplasmatota archaeon]